MPVSVELEGESVNKKEAPWRRSPRDLSDEDYIELYRYLYPFQGDPLLWVHLNTDYPYALQGILFFPKVSGRADWEKVKFVSTATRFLSATRSRRSSLVIFCH